MTAPIILLALSVFDDIGGLQRFNQRVVDTLSRGADETPRPLIVISLRDRTPRDIGVGCQYLPCSGSRAKMIAALIRTLRQGAPAAVLFAHVNLLSLSLLTRLLRPRTSTALFVHGIEVWNIPGVRRRRWYEPFLIRHCIGTVISVSRFTENVMRREFVIDHAVFRLQPNALDVTGSPERGDHSSGTHVITVSRLDEAYKGIGNVIAAVARLRRTWPTIALTIVGGGRLMPELKALARALHVDDVVRFPGEISDAELARAYSNADVFVLPSRREGFGIVFLEAWKHGLPVICGNADASPEVVTDGVSGVTVDPDDVMQLSEAIARLLADPDRRRVMAQHGFAELSGRFSGEAFAATLRGTMAALMAGAKD